MAPKRLALALVVVALASETALAAFPGANGRLSFNRNDQVWTVRPDRAGAVKLSDDSDEDDDAAWSPDGRKLAFSSDRDGSPDIWVMDADGRNPTQVTSGPDDDDHPAWSPDGTRLVFTRGNGGDEDVHVVNLDGTGLQNLTNDPSGDDNEPDWSPDGTRIAFSAGDDIFVIGADGSGRTNLTNDETNNDGPHWSPDGTRLAFQSDRDGDTEIFVMSADGTGVTQLTFDDADDAGPAWSPDGTRIAFETDRDGNAEIYVMDADGGNPTRITDDSADDADVDWQPRAFTTTTITTLSTTTTTVPGGAPATGRRLVLKDAPGKPEKRKLALVAKGRDVGAGTENGGGGDPVLHGGFVKIVSRSGDRFNTTYDLPAASWRYKGKVGRNKGYRLANAGPIRKIMVRPGKALAIVAQGSTLGHTLGADPKPVHVAIGLGTQRYCFTFGGKTKFKAGKTFVAKNSPGPQACDALVPACGDAALEAGESCPSLEGGADDLAVEATSNFNGEPGVPLAEIAVEGVDARIARTRVDVEFAPEATVAQVNAVLAQLGGEIVAMLANVPLLVVRIADPGSLPALDALIAGANTDPAVRVSRGHLDDPDELPPNFPQPETSDLTKIDNHLAVRAPAAWNARRAIDTVPLLVVGDSFGNGPPNFDFSALPVNPSDFGALISDDHGYHVLGIITATFGGNAPCAAGGALSPAALRGCATGMLPVFAPLRVADANALLTALAFRMAIVDRALGLGRVVLNTSRNECATGMCGSPAVAGDKARQWVLMVRGAGLEGRMFHATSAGNIQLLTTPGVTDAQTNSSFSAAALLPAIPDFFGTGTHPNLVNTLVVEDVVNGAAPSFAPLCLSITSKRGGHLSGIGTTVWSHTNANSTAGDLNGTSMATPQVAGLATYLWAIDPAMTVTQLAGLLRLTTTAVAVGSSSGQCDPASTTPAPIIDAYAAVLALDQATLPTPASAPVRHALFDLDDDDDFDEDDLFELQAILIDPSTGLVQEPPSPAFQRYDLNGDGFTGGGQRRVAFDLDREGSTQYGTSQFGQVTQTVEGVSVPFDETAVTDLDVFCYYAYSALYVGDEERRRDHLGIERCARIIMTVDFPSTIEPGLSETLRVTVGREGQGGSEPVPGIHIELTATGGNVLPESGTTNAQGEFTAQAELAVDSSSIEVVVQALDAPGGVVLAEEVVVAAGPCTDAPTDVQLDFGNGEDDPTVVGPTLQNGVQYRVTASGTYTVNSTQQWQNGVCKGTPAAGNGGPTGIDAEFFFAVPNGSALCGPDFQCCPNHTSKFRMSLDGGGAFAHLEPVSPAFDGSHVYEYLVQGQGMPVAFQLAEDNSRGDDYGILSINIACAADTTTTTASSTTSTSNTSTLPSTSTTTVSTTIASTTIVPTTSSTTTTTTLFGIPVIPYARYAATGPDGPVVMLEDEFTTETVNLGAVSLQLPPVTIDGQLPFDPFTSQTCHAHPGATLDECVDVQDRFGFAPLRIGNPVGVCAPELGASIGVDFFKCYAATGSAPEVSVDLADEFQSHTVTVGAPDLFCTPVAVDGSTLVNAIRYLVCYTTAPLSAAGGQVEVENALHQSAIQVDVGVASGLCVPAVRQLVATCQLCGNGVVDGDEDCDDAGFVAGDGCSPVCRFELDCTCDGLSLPPPNDVRCATLADCGGFCTACATGGGACGCQ